jgi:O-antigen ligase
MLCALGLFAMCVAWLLPGHNFPWTGFQQEALSAAGALLVVTGAIATRWQSRPRVPLIAMASLLLAAVPMLQWAAGLVTYLSDALLPTAYLAAFAMTIIAGAHLSQVNPRFPDVVLSTILFAALVSVGIGLIQWLQLGPYTLVLPLHAGARITANFGQPNHLASLLGLGVAGAWLAYERRHLSGVLAAAVVVLLAAGLVSTRSRVGWMFVAVYCVMWLAYRKRLDLRTPAGTVAGFAAAFAAAVPLWPWISRELTGVAGSVLSTRLASGERWTHLQTLWDACLRSPWVGYGWNQISIAQQDVVLDHDPSFEWLSSSHNQVLDLLVWNGLPLGILSIGVIAWWSVTRMRHCNDHGAWAAIVALAVLFAHAMVEYPLAYAYFLLPAGLLIGAVEGRMRQGAGSASATTSLPRSALTSVVLALGAVFYVICTDYLEIQNSVDRARMRDAGYASDVPVPDVRVLDGPREYVRLWITKNDNGDPGVDMAWLRTVTQRHATPPAMLRYAAAAAARGQREESHRALRVMCHISKPWHCDEGRSYWAGLAARMPELRNVAFPETPVPKRTRGPADGAS